MTARDGFSPDMDPLALDARTAERLVAGSLVALDAPPEYRAVAQTLQDLRQPPESAELESGPVAVERITAAIVVARRDRPEPRHRRSRARVGKLAALAAAAMALALPSGLAVAGALPESAQGVASSVLGKVGISIPTGDKEPAVSVPSTTAGPPPTAASPQPQPQPAANGADTPAPGPEAPPANGPAGSHGGSGGVAPPSTANAGGVGHEPNGPPDQTNTHSHRP